MFDWLLPEDHAITILKKDHDSVKALFDEFEEAEDRVAKDRIIESAIIELKIHAILEEKIFYPAVRGGVGGQIMNEADEEHHVAKVLIAELDSPDGGGNHRDAKFTVLSENVRHHIQEEENEMMPKARELDIDFVKLGDQMKTKKQQLLRDGIPSDAEHAMVAMAGGKGDSPKKAAVKHRVPKKATKPTRKASASPRTASPRKKTQAARGR